MPGTQVPFYVTTAPARSNNNRPASTAYVDAATNQLAPYESDTPPASPTLNPWWWNTADGQLYVYHTTAAAWVTANSFTGGNQYLPTTGGTITGNLSINNSLTVYGTTNLAAANATVVTLSSNNPYVILNKAASGNQNSIYGYTGASPRWIILPGNATAESGSSAGSDFSIGRYNDSGSFQNYSFTITRSTGLVSVNNGLAVTGGTTTDSMNGGPLAGFRNRIINGAFSIAQRGTSITIASGGGTTYTLDRWIFITSGATNSTGTVAQGYSYGAGYAYGNSPYFGSATNIALSANGYYQFEQRIESTNSTELGGTTATLSFYAAATNTGSTFSGVVYIGYPSTKDNFATTMTFTSGYGFAITGTPTKFTIPISIPVSAYNGLTVIIRLNNGAAPSTANTFNLGQVQLEPGTVATPFEFRPIGIELALCQRYFYQRTAVGQEAISPAFAYSTTQINSVFRFPVLMRVTPTVAVYNMGAFSNSGGAVALTSSLVSSSNPETITMNYAAGSATWTAGQATNVFLNAAGSYLLASAEL